MSQLHCVVVVFQFGNFWLGDKIPPLCLLYTKVQMASKLYSISTYKYTWEFLDLYTFSDKLIK